MARMAGAIAYIEALYRMRSGAIDEVEAGEILTQLEGLLNLSS
jgi:hypothetical protein